VKILLLIPVLVFSQFSLQAQRAQKQAQQVITLKLMPVAILHMPDNSGKGKTPPTTPPSKNMLVQTEVVSGTQTPALPVKGSATAQQATSQQNAVNSKYVLYTLTSL
jgi:hypothetical protein